MTEERFIRRQTELQNEIYFTQVEIREAEDRRDRAILELAELRRYWSGKQ